MEGKILKALKQDEGLKQQGYVSGENLARALGITRTAVWKHIRNLRLKGYQIRSSPKLGYRLEHIPDLLTPEEIKADLATQMFGRYIHYFNEVTSTQDEARRLAESGAAEGTLVVAEAQLVGRGRRGRHWVSPPQCGIYLSIIFRPDLEPFNIAQIPLVVAIGLCEAVTEITNLQPRIKWPNDILVGGEKVAGILVEISAEPERVHYMILGIGINVNTPASMFPEDLQPPATSLAEVAGHRISRRMLLQALLTKLEAIYDEFRQHGFETLNNRWRRWDQTINSWVEIRDSRGSFVGYALDIAKDGALIVRDQKGKIRRILAADASLKHSLPTSH